MSQKNNISQDNKNIEAASSADEKTTKLVVKRKRIKRSDVLVFGVCLLASVTVWLYASNLQKSAQEKELNKEDIAEVVGDKIAENESNRGLTVENNNVTEQSTSVATEISTQ